MRWYCKVHSLPYARMANRPRFYMTKAVSGWMDWQTASTWYVVGLLGLM
jgi:hypothetical protein